MKRRSFLTDRVDKMKLQPELKSAITENLLYGNTANKYYLAFFQTGGDGVQTVIQVPKQFDSHQERIQKVVFYEAHKGKLIQGITSLVKDDVVISADLICLYKQYPAYLYQSTPVFPPNPIRIEVFEELDPDRDVFVGGWRGICPCIQKKYCSCNTKYNRCTMMEFQDAKILERVAGYRM